MTAPIISFTVLFLLIFVNGFSDAPNSVSSAIASGALGKRTAIILAAAFDLIGVIVFSLLSPSVAYTVADTASFPDSAKGAVCAGMCAALLWALFAARFGIPTSESHAMSAAISGAALSSGGSVSAKAWALIAIGFLGFSLFAFLLAPTIGRLFAHASKINNKNVCRNKSECSLSYARSQALFCILCALMHGAQDGQKFVGLMMLFANSGKPHPVQVLTCAAILSAGTLCCSEKIIKQTAFETVRLNAREGFFADLTAFFLMLTASLTGIPVSTSSVKNSAMLGAQSLSRSRKADTRKAMHMIAVWLLTFPTCFALGAILTRIFTF